MKVFLKIIAFLIILVSILAGLYVGLYLMFYEGLVQFITSINIGNIEGIVTGFCRVFFCEISGIIPALGLILGGFIYGHAEDNY